MGRSLDGYTKHKHAMLKSVFSKKSFHYRLGKRPTDMGIINIVCPNCDEHVVWTEKDVGKKVSCKCSEWNVVLSIVSIEKEK